MDNNLIDSGVCVDAKKLIQIGSQASRLPLNLRFGAKTLHTGSNQSRFRGRGMDFAESREYLPGDDIRHVDWRVTARTGKMHTKLFVEERERPVYLLLDFSPTMYFGTRNRFKTVTAAEAAAFIAWSAINGGDRIGSFIQLPEKLISLKASSGKRAVVHLLGEIAKATALLDTANKATEKNTLDDLLDHSSTLILPGSLVFVLSDFYEVTNSSVNQLQRLRRHNDVVAIETVDSLELSPPSPGRYSISNGEDVATLDVLSRSARRRYVQSMKLHKSALQKTLGELSIPLLTLIGTENIQQKLFDTLGVAR